MARRYATPFGFIIIISSSSLSDQQLQEQLLLVPRNFHECRRGVEEGKGRERRTIQTFGRLQGAKGLESGGQNVFGRGIIPVENSRGRLQYVWTTSNDVDDDVECLLVLNYADRYADRPKRSRMIGPRRYISVSISIEIGDTFTVRATSTAPSMHTDDFTV